MTWKSVKEINYEDKEVRGGAWLANQSRKSSIESLSFGNILYYNLIWENFCI